MTLNQYEVGTTITLETALLDDTGVLYNPTTISGMVLSPNGTEDFYAVNTLGSGLFYFKYKITSEGEYTYSFISETPLTDLTTVDSGFFIGIKYDSSELDYLIPQLRDHLGDRDSRTYSTDFLRQILFSAFKALLPRWQYKYLIDSNNHIYRNTSGCIGEFKLPEPPVIQIFDERPIILQASIMIKSGSIYTSSSSNSFSSWRDDELSYSNIESGKSLQESLKNDIDELNNLLPLRTNKLVRTRRQSLPGFTDSVWNYIEGDN